MTNSRLEGKIVEFTETNWKLFPTFEHALQKWAEELLAEERKDLEKENAELKEEMNAKQVVLNDFKSRVETVTYRFNKKSSQLTKAKEIIKKMLYEYQRLCVIKKETIAEVEQFLKSEVEK